MISSSVLNCAAEIRARFQEATPFRHVAIENFLEPEACEKLLADFPTFDRTRALNELGEVGRKAVVERVFNVSPFYGQFYGYINSADFLRQVSKLTGVPDLIADPTLLGGGTHENCDGQYLDAHVDFNIDQRRMLHRRVNLLVYLNQDWDEMWGGNLQLHSNPRYPESNRTVEFEPLFNRAVIFETNEYSWHGFQAINLPFDKKHLSRKSFSIYLYTKERPAKEAVAPHTTFYLCRPLPDHIRPGISLSDSDFQYIRGLMANRDGLIQMYQNLLIEKEQRLTEFMRKSHGGVAWNRYWQVINYLHRKLFK
jgi:hypothetical protein